MRIPNMLATLAVVVSVSISIGCTKNDVDLADALTPARGHVEDSDGRGASIDDLLAAARGRPVSVSFAYVGCNGRTPRMERLRSAESAIAGGDVLHIVLNAVDEPIRYPDVVRDLTGKDPARLDPDRLRILFVDKGPLWPQQPSEAVDGIMKAIGLRYGKDRHVETVRGIGMFGGDGRLIGIRY